MTDDAMKRILSFYFDNGLLVVPTMPNEKRPTTQWKNVNDETTARELWEGRGKSRFGIVTGPSNVLVVDVDTKAGDDGWDALCRYVGEEEGLSPEQADMLLNQHPVQAITWSGGRHLYFQLEEGEDWPEVSTTRARVLPNVDLRGRGGFVVCPPSTFNGGGYKWLHRWGEREEIPHVPLWLWSLVNNPGGTRVEDDDDQGDEVPTRPSTDGEFDSAKAAEHHVRNALATASCGNRNQTGFQLANQLRDLGMTEGEALPFMQRFAAGVPQTQSDAYTEREAVGSLGSAYKYGPRDPAVPGAAYERSGAARIPPPDDDDEPDFGPPELRAPSPEREDRILDAHEVPPQFAQADTNMLLAALELNDEGNAQAFAHIHGDQYRFDRVRHKWFKWVQHVWRECDGSEATRAMVDTINKRAVASAYIADDKFRKKYVAFCVSSKNRMRALNGLDMAGTLPTLEWPMNAPLDADVELLGCTNGVLELSTGTLRPGRRSDLITRGSATRYDPNAKCPRFEQFLQEVFMGDQHVVDFVRRAAGYSLTGHTREQVLFLCHGKGANGKSVLLGALFDMLGEYASQTPFQTFEASMNDRQTNDLAALRGRRLVIASESQDGRRFDEARVKAVTGGDRVTARFLRQEFFTYLPTFKIWLAMNYKPAVRGTDEGIWRRMRLIPFKASFKGANADPDLPMKLRAEAEGILAWAVRGAVEWYKNGLQPPAAVLEATEAYRAESDVVGQFLTDSTVQVQHAKVPAGGLYDAYRRWCDANGQRNPMNSTRFGRNLADRGMEKTRTSGGQVYLGVSLLADGERTPLPPTDGDDEYHGDDDRGNDDAPKTTNDWWNN